MAVDHPRDSLRSAARRDGDNDARSDRGNDGLSAAAILSMCDRLLGEVGRRDHRFAWLRVPGSIAGEWLAVDAYYPRSRLVVMCRPLSGAHEALYRELIPARGLGLLALESAALGDDPASAEAAVAAKIFDLEHIPRPAARPSPAAHRSPASRAGEPSRSGRNLSMAPVSSPAPGGRDARGPEWTAVRVEHAAVPPAVEQGLGVVVGLALAVVLIAELYLGMVAVAFGAGRPILGFAIALEACSRGLGTVAAERAGERAWALACAIGGAPVVAWFALAPRDQRAAVEPAPLAGLLAVVAGLLALVGLLIGS
jgi:hypothetical protein